MMAQSRALHRHLLRPRGDLGARRRPAPTAAADAAAAPRDRLREGDWSGSPRARAGDRALVVLGRPGSESTGTRSTWSTHSPCSSSAAAASPASR
jgi:hypothetical protein